MPGPCPGTPAHMHARVQAAAAQDVWLVAPEKGNPQAVQGLAAMAVKLHREREAHLVRFVARRDITIGYMLPMPLPNQAVHPHTLLLMCMPYEADVRRADFPSFDAHLDLLPDVDQVAAMNAAMDALGLGDGAHLPQPVGKPCLVGFI